MTSPLLDRVPGPTFGGTSLGPPASELSQGVPEDTVERGRGPAAYQTLAAARHRPDAFAPRLLANDQVAIGDYRVPRLGFGCMRLLADSRVVDGVLRFAASPPAEPEVRRSLLLDAVHVCGIRYLDLARGYGAAPDAGERQIRSWLGGELPKGLLVASKVGFVRTPSFDWELDLTPSRLAAEVRDSARAFGAPVPLMYLLAHGDDEVRCRARPERLADALEPLRLAREEGTVRNIGLANVSLPELEELRHVAPIAVVQNKLTLAGLDEARPVIERCGELGIPFVAWGIFGEGRAVFPPELVDAARRAELTPEQLTIAKLLAAAPNLVVLPGPSRRETLYQCIRAANAAAGH